MHADGAAVGLVAAVGVVRDGAADVMVLVVGGEVEGDVDEAAADGEEGDSTVEDAAQLRVPDERYPQPVCMGDVEDVADMLCRQQRYSACLWEKNWADLRGALCSLSSSQPSD